MIFFLTSGSSVRRLKIQNLCDQFWFVLVMIIVQFSGFFFFRNILKVVKVKIGVDSLKLCDQF